MKYEHLIQQTNQNVNYLQSKFKLPIKDTSWIFEAINTIEKLITARNNGIAQDQYFKREEFLYDRTITSLSEGTILFMKALLEDLPKAYEASDYTQKRMLLGSIFKSGLVFSNGEFLNPEISPEFRDIRDPQSMSISLGVEYGTRTHGLVCHRDTL
jgi:hypothetical protein